MNSQKAQEMIDAISQKNLPHESLSTVLSDNIAMFTHLKTTCADLVMHNFSLYGRINATVVFIEGMIDDSQCGEFILQPLSAHNSQAAIADIPLHLYTSQVRTSDDLFEILPALFHGNVVILADGAAQATLVEIRGAFGRGIGEPETDRSVLGAREGFVEKIVINIALLRRKLRDVRLCVENHSVGRRGNTRVSVVYVRDITDPTIVQAVTQRIQSIDVDALVSAGQLIQYLEDAPHFIFPQVMPVERADLTAAALLEGRVVVFMDQIPQALILPAVLWDFFRAADDEGEKAYIGTIKRWLRIICFFAGVLLPAWYVALLSFHPELIPLKLATALMRLRSGVPLPVTVEVLFIETLLAILGEASLRTPNQMSQTIGLAGGVILGNALLASNLATAPTLVIATAGVIAQYAMPSYVIMRLMSALRIACVAAAAVGGLFGVSIFWFIVLAKMVQIKTYSIPYVAPLGTSDLRHLKSLLFLRRTPRQKKRPTYIPIQDETRQR